MRQRIVTRILLFVLAAVTLLYAVRTLIGTPPPEGVVVFNEDFDVDELRHAAFVVQEPAAVEVEATGSLQSDSTLAAYGWIVRRDDRELVWSMMPGNVTRGRGALVSTQTRVALDAGTYDAYYASFGDPLSPVEQGDGVLERLSRLLDDDFARWRTETDRWSFIVRAAAPEDAAHLRPLNGERESDFSNQSQALIWETGPVEDEGIMDYFFTVTNQARVRVYALGEWDDDARDFGWIEDVRTGERVWEMTSENTEHAGGSVKNRMVRAEISLTEGPYRVVFESDREHDYRHWSANPPYDPAGWGLQLVAEEAGTVAALEPAAYFPRIADLTPVGNDDLRRLTFTLDRPLRVWVRAMGEFVRGHRYDYGWILNEETNEMVWQMEEEETLHAGGHEKNRKTETVLSLDEGTYTVYYQTDDSHAYGAFNSTQPDHPEQWGITLYALDSDYVPIIEDEQEAIAYMDKVEAEGALVYLKSLRNNARVQQTFRLDEPTTLHVFAVGEMTRSERYDYGWIVRDSDGQTVWEMTRRNTAHAGGASKNRKFDGFLKLMPGSYTAHFVTDGSHAFDDFEGGVPADPDAWGMVVRPAAAAPPPPPPSPGV